MQEDDPHTKGEVGENRDQQFNRHDPSPWMAAPAGAAQQTSEPAFNLPSSIVWISVALIAIHILTQVIDYTVYSSIIQNFAFIPLAYWVPAAELPVPMARFWSPITYFFLHGDWIHLLANLTWFAAFGSAVARRFANRRFVLFLVLATVASALAHFAFNAQSIAPVIGASGAVSACMGAAVRFGFAPNDPKSGAMRPSMSLLQSLSNPGMLIFIAVWFGFNWLFGAGIVPIPGVEGQIAWEAHMGGFVFGLLAFAWFDPVGKNTRHL